MANEATLKWQNESLEQNQQENEGASPRVREAIQGIKKFTGGTKKIYDSAQKAKMVAQTVQVAATTINPWVWVILIACVVIGIILYIFFFSGNLEIGNTNNESETTPITGSDTKTPAPSIPGLKIILTGPSFVNNGEDIVYTVSYTYDQSVGKIPVENIVLFDKIPENAIFVSTDGVQAADSTPTLVTWSLAEPSNQKPFKIILRPKEDDVYITNTVSAKIAKASGTGSLTGDPPEFLALVVGQGRNTSVLGDRANFISTIIANASGLPLAGKEAYLGQIYDAGLKYNVNPLILSSIWGTESGFDAAGTYPYPFGCLNENDTGFTENVTCAAGSLDKLMKKFEAENTNGYLEIKGETGNTCIYTDPFVYAYEWYAPICHAYDQNDAARSNFTSFYKKFRGI